MTEYAAFVSADRCMVAADKHAHATGWAFDRESDTYVLTLLDAEGQVMAAACYTFESWMDVFERLKAAGAMLARDNGYRDEAFSERACERCGKPYRGPAVYCSFACAEADA